MIFFRDEDNFFEAFVHELEKVDGLMEEMQTLSQEERSRITRRTSVAEDDLDVNGKVQTVLNALQGEDELQKSKVAKVFKEKSRLLTMGIKRTTLGELLKEQGKTNMNFPRRLGFKAMQKMFTKEGSDRMSGKANTQSFQCSVIMLSALNRETRERALNELIPASQKETIKYDEDLEDQDDDGAAASQDFPDVGQHQMNQKSCNLCDFTSASSDSLTNHIGQEHPNCNVCAKRFATDGDLRAHLPSHVMIQCTKCGKEIQKTDLKKHMEEHKTIEEFKKSVNKEKIRKVAPKAAETTRNPWFNFLKEQRANVKRSHPLYSAAQITQELGQQWRKLTPEEKAAWKDIPGNDEIGNGAVVVGHGAQAGGGHGDAVDRQVMMMIVLSRFCCDL